eukprot:c27532_g1_i1 orf=77-1882(+)
MKQHKSSTGPEDAGSGATEESMLHKIVSTSCVAAGAPGGPLFISGFVSPLINVREFQGSCANLLKALGRELNDLPFSVENIDVSVDDLRIITDEDLVKKALMEFEDACQQKQGEVDEGIACESQSSETIELQGNGESFAQPLEDKADPVKSIETFGKDVQLPIILDETGSTNMLRDSRMPICDDYEPAAGTTSCGGSRHLECRMPLNDSESPNAATGESISCIPSPARSSALSCFENKKAMVMRYWPQGDLNSRQGKNRNLETGQQKKKKKRGKPFDRDLRAAELDMNGDSIKEERLTMLKREREVAKENTPLLSLRTKKLEGVPTCSAHIKTLKALNFFTSALKVDSVTLKQIRSVTPYEVILCIEFYHGIKKQHKLQEFLVLGSQPLTALRDKLYCLTDKLMQKANMYVPSGYFLFEDTFYNDMRDARAIEYSNSIINWVKEQNEAVEKWKAAGGADFRKRQRTGLPNSFSPYDKLPTFQAADMASTQFWQLQCHIGEQYLYCHQGDCKHAIVIRDMRLVHKQDVQNMLCYPVLRFQPRLRHRKCSICDIYRAKKVTYGDKMAPTSPCFFCEHCYYLLHYSKEGALLDDGFKVYDYYHE